MKGNSMKIIKIPDKDNSEKKLLSIRLKLLNNKHNVFINNSDIITDDNGVNYIKENCNDLGDIQFIDCGLLPPDSEKIDYPSTFNGVYALRVGASRNWNEL
jgi:hypothetical protein